MIRILALCALLATLFAPAPASAALSPAQTAAAETVVAVLLHSVPCNYALSQQALERYYAANDVANADGLGLIAMRLTMKDAMSAPTPEACRAAQAKASELDLLAP